MSLNLEAPTDTPKSTEPGYVEAAAMRSARNAA